MCECWWWVVQACVIPRGGDDMPPVEAYIVTNETVLNQPCLQVTSLLLYLSIPCRAFLGMYLLFSDVSSSPAIITIICNISLTLSDDADMFAIPVVRPSACGDNVILDGVVKVASEATRRNEICGECECGISMLNNSLTRITAATPDKRHLLFYIVWRQ